jgi:tight adherence protein C
MAFENLARRVDVDVVRQIVTVLNQAERYGTPMAQALRSVAQESRDMRMAEAERKAAALPPKLTVPMIIFFLPALFVVILGPVASQTLKAFF